MRFLAILLLIVSLNKSLLSPPAPSPWFVEHVALESVDLPSEVNASFVTDESGRLSNEFIVFRNASSTPLYIVGKAGEGHWKFDEISVEFPNGTGPVYKIVGGQAYIWNIKYNHPGTGYYFDWFKENQRDDSVWLYVFGNRVLSETGTILDIEPWNQFDGGRPKDVIIPDSQKVMLSTVYGTEIIQIPLTVSYTLNTNYRSYSDFMRSESLINFFFILIFIVIIVAVVLFIAWVFREVVSKITYKK
jgi:hypothetical protein